MPQADNPLPPDHTVATLDALFARANDGESAGLPSVEGPCVYVRRDCLATVGSFDGAPLGSDYAVITDFSLRAASAGFRHHLAGDVFVGHAAHASFGPQATGLRERALHALDRLYPGMRRGARRSSRTTPPVRSRGASTCCVSPRAPRR